MKTLKPRFIRVFIPVLAVLALLTTSCSGFLDIPNEAGEDTAKIGLSSNSASLTVHEKESINLQYMLNKHPTANVTFTVTFSGATDEAEFVSQTLTFTPENWNQVQTIVFSGKQDDVADGNKTVSVNFSAAISDDSSFSGYIRPSESVTIIDIDSPGITVTPTSGLQTSEGGNTASFSVVLNSKPNGNVTIPVKSSDTSEGTVAVSQLTFTPTNWNSAQAVVVTGVDDHILDGNKDYQIVLGAAASTDSDYDKSDPDDISVTNKDDDSASVIVSKTTLGDITEGNSSSFTVKLGKAPALNADGSDGTMSVTIKNPAVSRATLNGSSSEYITLTFTTSNYSTAQSVTFAALANNDNDGNVSGTLEITTQNYQDIDPEDVTFRIIDDDTPGFIVSSSLSRALTEGGQNAVFTVRLASKPTADVTVDIDEESAKNQNTGNPACSEGVITYIGATKVSAAIPSAADFSCSKSGSISKTLTFTPTNWNSAQTVTVVGVDDEIDDGNTQFTIKLLAAVSTDRDYNGLNPADVSANNNNDDTAGFIIVAVNQVDAAESTYTTADAKLSPIYGFATDDMNVLDNSKYSQFTIRLRSEPTADVVLNLAVSSSNADGLFRDTGSSSKSLTFTTVKGGTNGWNIARTVKLKGNSDNSNEGNHQYQVIVTPATADSNYSSESKVRRPEFRINSCDNDKDNLLISCSRSSSLLATSESGATAKVWFIAQSAPASTATIPVYSNAEASNYTTNGFSNSEAKVTTGGGGTAAGTPFTANARVTTGNWNTMTSGGSNYVTAQGIDDSVFDGNKPYKLVTQAAVGGLTYDCPDVNIYNIDNETAFIITQVNTTEGNTAADNKTFGIRLGMAPTKDVSVSVSCQSASCAFLGNSSSPGTVELTFTAANWNSAQNVQIVPLDNHQADGLQKLMVKFTALATEDPILKDIQSSAMQAGTNADNDRLLWLTNYTFAGNFNATAADLSSIDNNCAASANDGNAPTDDFFKPSNTTYKALLVHSSLRVATTNGTNASGQSSWVLEPNTEYYLKSGSAPYTTKLFKTNAYGLIPASLATAFGDSSSQFWTGMNGDMTASGYSCGNWSNDSAQGQYGIGGSTARSTAISSGYAACSTASGVKKKLLCVQQ